MISKSIKYRADINGLRAIAVILVIFFHFYPRLLSGGFVGVDIFFVISSYLITTIIIKEIYTGTFSFRNFYSRRIRRILPLLFTVLFVTFVLAYFIFLPPEFDSFSQSLLSACVSLSNIYFLNANDYFALNSNQLPLLHTWSLGVEEQFYFLWPLLLFVVIKYIKNKYVLGLIMLLIFAGSLIFAVRCSVTLPPPPKSYEHFTMLAPYSYGVRLGTNYGYYTIFSRAYELMLGAILALGIYSRKINFLENSPNKTLIANFFALVGIILIIGSGFLMNEKSRFPGWIALIPDLGAVLCIYAGYVSSNNIISKILSTKLLVSIGLISYSLYLWHWPVLAFYRYLTPSAEIPFTRAIILSLIILAISVLTYFYIEKPVKKEKTHFSKLFLKYQVVPLLLLSFPAYYAVQSFGYQQRLSKEVVFLSNKYCFSNMDYNHLDSTDNTCIVGDTTAKPTKILLFGDSYAAQFASFFDTLGKKYKFSVKVVTTSMCYPLLDTQNHLPSSDPTVQQVEKCHQQIKYLTNTINSYDVVIMGGTWRGYLNTNYKINGEDFDFNTELKNTLALLSSQHKKTVIIAAIPVVVAGEFSSFIRRYNLHLNASIKNNNFTFDDGPKYKDMITKIINDDPNVYYFDVNQDIFSKIRTLPFLGKNLLYYNEGHIGQNGSEVLAKFYLKHPESQELTKMLTDWKIIA